MTPQQQLQQACYVLPSQGMQTSAMAITGLQNFKVPQLPLSALHTQPIACSNSAADLQDSPRPGLQQPPCIHHPPGTGTPTLGTPCWAEGDPWPDSPRPGSQPSLALPLSLQDAVLLTRPAVGLGSAPDNITLPHCPRLSLPQSFRPHQQATLHQMQGLQVGLLVGC